MLRIWVALPRMENIRSGCTEEISSALETHRGGAAAFWISVGRVERTPRMRQFYDAHPGQVDTIVHVSNLLGEEA